MRVMLAGQIGREAAVATRLAAEGHEIHAVSEFYNPTLVGVTEESGGELHIVRDLTRSHQIGLLAKTINPDLLWVNTDNMLAKDVVGVAKKHVPDMLVASPDKKSA